MSQLAQLHQALRPFSVPIESPYPLRGETLKHLNAPQLEGRLCQLFRGTSTATDQELVLLTCSVTHKGESHLPWPFLPR